MMKLILNLFYIVNVFLYSFWVFYVKQEVSSLIVVCSGILVLFTLMQQVISSPIAVCPGIATSHRIAEKRKTDEVSLKFNY